MDSERLKRFAINEPRHAHELTFSCYHRFPFLKAQRTCLWLAESIQKARQILDFELWAYVLMPEHVHIIIRPRRAEYDISDILKAIKEPVGRCALAYLSRHAPMWLPRVTVKRGQRVERHFWQPGGGYDRNILSGQTLSAMIDYIHLNPVRRGLLEQACQWPWSSASWYQERAEKLNNLRPDPIPPEWTEDSRLGF